MMGRPKWFAVVLLVFAVGCSEDPSAVATGSGPGGGISGNGGESTGGAGEGGTPGVGGGVGGEAGAGGGGGIPPTVSISTPADPGNSCSAGCGADGVCVGAFCAHGWGQSYEASANHVAVAATQTGADSQARVCSDSILLVSQPACASTGFYQVATASIPAQRTSFDLTGLMPEGLQRVIAELQIDDQSGWISSLDATGSAVREILVMVDRVSPTGAFTQPTGGFVNAADGPNVIVGTTLDPSFESAIAETLRRRAQPREC